GIQRMDVSINPADFSKVNNVYMDRSKVSVSNCNYSGNIIDKTLNLYDDSVIPVYGSEGELLAAPKSEQFIPWAGEPEDGTFKTIIREYTSRAIPQTACQFVNNNNSQPNYFKNNMTNAP